MTTLTKIRASLFQRTGQNPIDFVDSPCESHNSMSKLFSEKTSESFRYIKYFVYIYIKMSVFIGAILKLR